MVNQKYLEFKNIQIWFIMQGFGINMESYVFQLRFKPAWLQNMFVKTSDD